MNIATNSMLKLTKMLLNTDAKLKEMGTEPYGTRKATPKEQRERVKNLTEGELMAMIDEHGIEDVNVWLRKFWKEESYA